MSLFFKWATIALGFVASADCFSNEENPALGGIPEREQVIQPNQVQINQHDQGNTQNLNNMDMFDLFVNLLWPAVTGQRAQQNNFEDNLRNNNRQDPSYRSSSSDDEG